MNNVNDVNEMGKKPRNFQLFHLSLFNYFEIRFFTWTYDSDDDERKSPAAPRVVRWLLFSLKEKNDVPASWVLSLFSFFFFFPFYCLFKIEILFIRNESYISRQHCDHFQFNYYSNNSVINGPFPLTETCSSGSSALQDKETSSKFM